MRSFQPIVFAAALLAFGATTHAADSHVDAVNERFLADLAQSQHHDPRAVALVRESWTSDYRDAEPGAFVPDALAVLSENYRAALVAFDEGRFAIAATRFAALRDADDPYLAANALYFHVRSLVETHAFEEAEHEVTQGLKDDRELAAHTPYAPHLLLLCAYAQVRNLRTTEAQQTLATLTQRYPDAPEPVLVGARQLSLRLERSAPGSLPEVADLMRYAADRLAVRDAGETVKQRQAKVVALLDELIEQAQEQERRQQQQAQAGGQSGGMQPGQTPSNPATESTERSGPGDVGVQHGVGRAQPGEMWGKLPPAEREQVLQSLRERWPSRYRHLVEQYYRALAEEQ